jgi:transcriptional regulator with XRE-family HTH domain
MKGSAGPIDRHLGKRIRARRNALHLTRSALAEKLGVSGEQIRQYELGHNRLSAAGLYEMSLRLNVSIAFFYDGFARQTAAIPGFDEAGQENYVTSAIDTETRARLRLAVERIFDPRMRASLSYIIEHLPVGERSLDQADQPVAARP